MIVRVNLAYAVLLAAAALITASVLFTVAALANGLWQLACLAWPS